MASFKDNTGREWPIEITIGTVKRVRQRLSVDIPGLIANKMVPLGELLADPVKFVDVLYVICSDRMRTLPETVSDEEFGAAMGGDAIGSAADAFLEALVDFFPPRERPGLAAILATARRLGEEVQTAQIEKLASLDLKTIASGSTGSSGTSPASSESTPPPSPSASLP